MDGGTWLSSNQQYVKWNKSAGSDLLWIVGKPGSGKSTLAKLIVRKLRAEAERSNTTVKAGNISRNSQLETQKDQWFHTLKDESIIIAAFYYSFRG
jgi:adenylate kinase family enzyme